MINNKNIKQNFQKYSERLVKAMLIKNNVIFKNCQVFDEEMNEKNNINQENSQIEED